VTIEAFDLRRAIESLEAMPAFLDAAIAAAPADALMRRPQPGHFSLGEHACHLRDLEREGYLVRVQRMVAEDSPALEGFDGDAVAAARDYPSQDARRAAQEFAAARRSLAGMLAPLTAEHLSRPATFEGEPITFAGIIDMMLRHDAEHREEIGRMRWK
jgi:hypothetical protein